MTSRRVLLKGLTLGTGATLLQPMVSRVLANAEGTTPSPRFVFVIQSNGLDGIPVCPESIPFLPFKERDSFEEFSFHDHKLPMGMEAFEGMQDRLTAVQGLSGRCTGGGHSIHGGALGLYRTSEASRSPVNETSTTGSAAPTPASCHGSAWACRRAVGARS